MLIVPFPYYNTLWLYYAYTDPLFMSNFLYFYLGIINRINEEFLTRRTVFHIGHPFSCQNVRIILVPGPYFDPQFLLMYNVPYSICKPCLLHNIFSVFLMIYQDSSMIIAVTFFLSRHSPIATVK